MAFIEIIIGIVIVAGIIALAVNHIIQLTTIKVDERGYERNGYGRLIHRMVAYDLLYNYPNTHSLRFRYYDVHHIDRNKRNNSHANLKILTRQEHKAEHNQC